jgi:hypothetical protein
MPPQVSEDACSRVRKQAVPPFEFAAARRKKPSEELAIAIAWENFHFRQRSTEATLERS